MGLEKRDEEELVCACVGVGEVEGCGDGEECGVERTVCNVVFVCVFCKVRLVMFRFFG